jgi:hypothetical protein
MSLTSISIILTVIVLQFHYTGSYAPEISDGLYNFFTKYIAIWIGMSETVQRYESKRNLKKNSKKNEPKSENSMKNGFIIFPSNNMHSSNNQYSINTPMNKHKMIEYESNNKLNRKIDIINSHKNTNFGVELKINDQAKMVSSFPEPKTREATNILKKRKSSINNKMEDCVKKISCLTLNIQRYISLHEEQEKDINVRNKLKLIAEIIDRFLFWIFLVITFTSTITLLLIIPYLKNNYFSKKLTKTT